MAISTVLLVLALANPVAFAAQHTVGGNSGWTNFGTDYTTWAAGKTFNVGDTLVFNYDSTTHKVDQVSQSDYNSCSSSNALKTHDNGATTITLSKAGPMYFICPTPGHCSSGMKLAINVVAAGTTPTTPGNSPSSPTKPASPTTDTPSPAYRNGALGIFSESLLLGAMVALMA